MDSPAMQAALEAVAQAGREGRDILDRPRAFWREQSFKCLALAAAHRQAGNAAKARFYLDRSREFRQLLDRRKPPQSPVVNEIRRALKLAQQEVA